MKDHPGLTISVSDSFLKGIYGKLRIDPAAVDTRYYTTVIQIDDRTVVTSVVLTKRQISEVHTPLGIAPVCMEILLQKILEKTIRLRTIATSAFRFASDGLQAKFFVHIVMNCMST